MVKVKYSTKNEVLSISESMNGDSVVAQSTFCLNFKKICAVLRSCWQSSRENLGMSCIMNHDSEFQAQITVKPIFIGFKYNDILIMSRLYWHCDNHFGNIKDN